MAKKERKIIHQGRNGTVTKEYCSFNPEYCAVRFEDTEYPEFWLRKEIQEMSDESAV